MLDTHKKNTPCRWLGVCSRCVTKLPQQFLREKRLAHVKKKLGHSHSDAFFMLPTGFSIKHGHSILSRNLTHPTHNRRNARDPDTQGKRVCVKTEACITSRLVGTFTAAIVPNSVKCPSIDLHGPFDDVFRLEGVFHGQVRVGVLHQPVPLAWSIFSQCHAAHTEIVTINRCIPC